MKKFKNNYFNNNDNNRKDLFLFNNNNYKDVEQEDFPGGTNYCGIMRKCSKELG